MCSIYIDCKPDILEVLLDGCLFCDQSYYNELYTDVVFDDDLDVDPF